MAHVLLITDRPDDLLPLVNGLTTGGHRPVVTGSERLPDQDAMPDVAVVDAVKDIARGRDACRTLRARAERMPIIVLVAQENLDAVGLDWEVSTFLMDPVSIPESLTRIRLALGTIVPSGGKTVRVGELSIDPDTYQVRVRARPLDLTYKEFQLLFFLAQRPGRVFTRQQLLQEVWGYDFFGGTRTVDVHVRRLRAKLGAEHDSMIVTIRNVGYKLEGQRR